MNHAEPSRIAAAPRQRVRAVGKKQPRQNERLHEPGPRKRRSRLFLCALPAPDPSRDREGAVGGASADGAGFACQDRFLTDVALKAPSHTLDTDGGLSTRVFGGSPALSTASKPEVAPSALLGARLWGSHQRDSRRGVVPATTRM